MNEHTRYLKDDLLKDLSMGQHDLEKPSLRSIDRSGEVRKQAQVRGNEFYSSEVEFILTCSSSCVRVIRTYVLSLSLDLSISSLG